MSTQADHSTTGGAGTPTTTLHMIETSRPNVSRALIVLPSALAGARGRSTKIKLRLDQPCHGYLPTVTVLINGILCLGTIPPLRR